MSYDYNPIDINSRIDINKILVEKVIYTDIIFRGERIEKLEGVEKIDGFVGISESTISDFGELQEITGDLWTSFHNVYSPLNSLGNIEAIGGDVNLRYSNVNDLGELQEVGGKLSLRDTPIQSLGKLRKVGGDLFLPKRLENTIDVAGVEVGGKVRFWNDNKNHKTILPKSELGLTKSDQTIPLWKHKYIYSFSELEKASKSKKEFYEYFKESFFNEVYIDLEGSDNYAFALLFDIIENVDEIKGLNILSGLLSNLGSHYPVTEGYCNQMLQERLDKEQDYLGSWILVSKEDKLTIEQVLKYEYLTNRELLNASIVLKIIGTSMLKNLKVGQIELAKELIDKALQDRRTEIGIYFFDEFIYKSYMNKEDEVRFKFNRNVNIESDLPYDEEYYKKFFSKEKDYFHYLEIDRSQVGVRSRPTIPHVIQNGIKSELRIIVKLAVKRLKARSND